MNWTWKRHRELTEELRAHVEERAADLIDSGVPEREAYEQARRELGNATLLTERGREVWAWMWVERLAQDLRYASRTLRQNPGFSTVAILSLALGIGANTAIFGLMDVLLLKSLPVRAPEELLLPAELEGSPPKPNDGLTYQLFSRYQKENRSFESLAGFGSFTWRDKSVSKEGPWRGGQFVSGNYFDVLGVGAALGRTLAPSDDSLEATGGPQGPVAMLSYNHWVRTYRGDPAVLGKSINVNGAWVSVVGVTPPEFFGTVVGRSPDIFVPMMLQPVLMAPTNLLHDLGRSRIQWVTAIGRLKPGVSHAQAGADLASIFESYHARFRRPGDRAPAVRIAMQSGAQGLSALRSQFSTALQFLMGLVGIVLLIACANVANLLLARGAARQKEIAVRLAIGAARARIIRQLLTESLLIGLISAAIGVVFALWSSRLLVAMLPQGVVPLALEVRPDIRLLGFAAAVAIITSLLFGLAPALSSTRLSLGDALKQVRESGARLRRFSLSKALVAAEVALAVPLVLGAGLLVGTLRKLLTVDAGFTRQNVVQIRFDVDAAAYPQEQWQTIYDQVLERVGAVPGVTAASLTNRGLMEPGVTRSGPVHYPGYTFAPGEPRVLAETYIGPNYFTAAGIPLRLGRSFTPNDGTPSRKVAIVNETFVQRYFRGQNPVGKFFGMGDNPDDTEIIGVVADAKYNDLRQEDYPMAYYPWRQVMPARLRTVVVRTQGDSRAITQALRQAIASLNADLLQDIRTLDSQIGESLVRERMLATLSGFFGLLAMLLACMGLYGVVSYGVARRTPEIGIRVALGARSAGVKWMVLRETIALAAIGLLIGVPGAISLSRFTESFLYGIKPNDPWLLSSVLFTMTGVSVAAGYLPARRAARVDPMVALRNE